jgi:pimeloyl-ACP methyl ester carboxylesterase
LQGLPFGDLRQFTTWIAVRDIDAVRRALGAERINIVGASYGTRAALEYLRQFPQQVRRMVLDGVAPADMALPQSSAADSQAAFDAMLKACADDETCRARHPMLREHWHRLLGSMPKAVTLADPLTGGAESVRLTRARLLALVRAPLYVPAQAAALPMAIDAAFEDRFGALFALSSLLQPRRELRLAEGMHFAVICAEDLPRLAAPPFGAIDNLAPDFGDALAEQYRQACSGWTAGDVPSAFYDIPRARSPVLLLSGAADPATPPRHAARVAKALGSLAVQAVVPEAGHGLMSLPCLRDAIYRFIDADSDAAALRVDVDCARGLPRPLPFQPLSQAASR